MNLKRSRKTAGLQLLGNLSHIALAFHFIMSLYSFLRSHSSLRQLPRLSSFLYHHSVPCHKKIRINSISQDKCRRKVILDEFFFNLELQTTYQNQLEKKQYIYIYNTIHTNTYTQITLMFSQDDIQLVMYIRTNSFGSSTAVVSLFTTSMECRLMSMLTRTVKYLDRHLHVYVHGKRNFACYKKIVD